MTAANKLHIRIKDFGRKPNYALLHPEEKDIPQELRKTADQLKALSQAERTEHWQKLLAVCRERGIK